LSFSHLQPSLQPHERIGRLVARVRFQACMFLAYQLGPSPPVAQLDRSLPCCSRVTARAKAGKNVRNQRKTDTLEAMRVNAKLRVSQLRISFGGQPMGAGPTGPDGNADAFAAVAVITVVVAAVSLWLAGMPA